MIGVTAEAMGVSASQSKTEILPYALMVTQTDYVRVSCLGKGFSRKYAEKK